MKKRIGKILLYLIVWHVAFLIQNASFAQIIEANISPQQPVMKESFFLEMKLEMTGDAEPYISFDVSGCEVLGRQNAGEQVSTIIVNGRISTSRSSIVRFEIVCNQQGLYRISDIQAEVGDKKYTHQTIQFKISSKPSTPEEVFVDATIDKEEVFLGEGIDLNYYLYRRVSVHANEIKQFPKLNGFIKRFHMPNSNPERVQYGNAMYIRMLIYSAKIFPETAGELKIDPIKVQVQYASDNFMSPFGAFGMGRIKTKTAASAAFTIKVLPLPTPPSDGFYTGLVGEHEFNLQVPRTKFLANETIEAKLIVKGEGPLENMEAPTLYKHENLESFNVKASFEEIDKKIARKSFDYTLIGRSNLEIAELKQKLYTFNPQKKSYDTVEIVIPAISISGASIEVPSSISQSKSNEKSNAPVAATSKFIPVIFSLVAPDFTISKGAHFRWNILRLLSMTLFILPLLLYLAHIIPLMMKPAPIRLLTHAFRGKTVDYKVVYNAIDNLNMLMKESPLSGPREFLQSIKISQASKEYFLKIINQAEEASYNLGQKNINVKIEKGPLRELENYVKENLSKS